MGIVNPLGVGKNEVAQNLLDGSCEGMMKSPDFLANQDTIVGKVNCDLPVTPLHLKQHDSRNNRLILKALLEIDHDIQYAISKYGKKRIAVVMGTSTTGISDNEIGIVHKLKNGHFPEEFEFARQETSSISEFVAGYYGLEGPCVTISTACTSSAKTLSAARRYIETGFCDAAIVGGADTLCRLTLNGFNALDSLSIGKCAPFGVDRDGINIGEGAVAFLMTKEKSAVELLGIGETSDAYHISAPAPEGVGAKNAMKKALNDACLTQEDIGYVNLHGTATPLNDAMESSAVYDVFGANVPCSSTKTMTGHMLGAAGGNEIGFLWLILQDSYSNGLLPPQLWQTERDTDLKPICFVDFKQQRDRNKRAMMSNSFAFGGNNISVILGVHNAEKL